MQKARTCSRKRKTQVICAEVLVGLIGLLSKLTKTYAEIKSQRKVKCVNQVRTENKILSYNENYSVVSNMRLCFHNANFVNRVYVQLHNTQTSVDIKVKIKTPSAFRIGMRIRN